MSQFSQFDNEAIFIFKITTGIEFKTSLENVVTTYVLEVEQNRNINCSVLEIEAQSLDHNPIPWDISSGQILIQNKYKSFIQSNEFLGC